MKYCPYCGAGLQEEMRFCPSCGKKYIGAADAETSAPMPEEPPVPTPAQPTPTTPTFDVSTPVKVSPTKKRSPLPWILAAVLILALAVGGVLLFGGGKPEAAIPFSDDTEAIQKASASVILLSCYDRDGELYATGSAFAAFEPGVFVTNCHVILEDVYSIKGQTESGMEFDIPTVVAYDEARDLAILRTDADTGLVPLPVGNTGELEKGAKVTAIGSPLGLINSVSTGVYSGIVTEAGQDYLQFTAAISHGSSGGALFNDKGEVIGVTSSSYVEGQNLNFAVPVEDVIRLSSDSSSKPLSIHDFYNLWEHIPTYDVSYVLSHASSLNGQQIYAVGYISSIDYGAEYEGSALDGSLYLVASITDVLGYTFQEGASWDYSHNNRQGEDPTRAISLKNLEISAIDRDEVRQYSPGDYVSVHCIVRFSSFSEGLYFQGSRYIGIELA